MNLYDIPGDIATAWEQSLSHVFGSDLIARIVVVIAIIVITLLAAHFVIHTMNKVLERNDSSLANVSIFENVIRVFIYFIGLCAILDAGLGINVTAFITALGIGGLALSLGAQDTLKNLIGGATIVFGKLFRPGDNITIGGQTGVVRDIGWRETTIVNRSGEVVIVPNTNASTSAITVTAPLEKASVPFVVTNGRDLNEVAKELEAAAAEAVKPLATLEKQPQVQYSEITEYGARGKVFLWTDNGDLVVEVCDAIARAIAPIVR